jgi:hypothetical protein
MKFGLLKGLDIYPQSDFILKLTNPYGNVKED